MSLFSEAGLQAIEEAIAGGYLEVEYDDKRVKYRSLSELLQVRFPSSLLTAKNDAASSSSLMTASPHILAADAPGRL